MDNINDTIQKFKDVEKERTDLNTKIREHYTPLLKKAGENNNEKEFNELVSELPDCPFLITAHRWGMFYEFNTYIKK